MGIMFTHDWPDDRIEKLMRPSAREAVWASGPCRLKDALAIAQEVSGLRGNTPEFAYNFACLQSRLGNTDAAFDWFNKAIALCHSHVVRAKEDRSQERT